MKIQPIVIFTLGVMLIPGTAQTVELYAAGKSDAEIRTEIVIRCQSQMGEFGTEAVDICVQAEHESREQLAEYPDEYFEIVRRCNKVMYRAGWNRIKLCSDKDIAARDALAAYPQVHAELIATCQSQVGRYGHNEVKKCVDEKLAASGESTQ
ncbi:MAG: hypothetical protein JSW48_13465 [Betaproteobacteria bacterium]|nr:MAG: hypothetical protein JSW48_13465 [Betaproteobacteria bacterium]